MDELQKTLLMQVAGLHEVPAGAYNIRANGEPAGRQSTEHIEIVPKEDQPGIDIFIKPGTKKESVHIPVLMTQTGLKELVYNDFHIGEDCDVTIVAGCGIHNGGDKTSEHSGIHSFFIGKNSKVRYVEKHYGSGEGTGERVDEPGDDRQSGRGQLYGDGYGSNPGGGFHRQGDESKDWKGSTACHQRKANDAWQTEGDDKFLCGFGRRGLEHKRDFAFCGKGFLRADLLLSY